jgi:hypothetical protein
VQTISRVVSNAEFRRVCMVHHPRYDGTCCF